MIRKNLEERLEDVVEALKEVDASTESSYFIFLEDYKGRLISQIEEIDNG